MAPRLDESENGLVPEQEERWGVRRSRGILFGAKDMELNLECVMFNGKEFGNGDLEFWGKDRSIKDY